MTVTTAARALPVLITQALLDSGCTTTVSNTGGAHCLIHAPTNPEYRHTMDRVAKLPYEGRNNALCSAQVRLSSRFVSVRPTWCMREGGYFYLRNIMNLGDTWPAGRAQYPTLQACMDAALEWCLAKPEYREAIVYTSDLAAAGIVPL